VNTGIGYNRLLCTDCTGRHQLHRGEGNKKMSVPYVILLILEAVLGLFMVGLILIHAPKGEGMGGIGTGATMFSGKRGAEAGLDKLTWGVAGSFMFVCMLLGFGLVK
jgi:preprotein translocase subunit SecG